MKYKDKSIPDTSWNIIIFIVYTIIEAIVCAKVDRGQKNSNYTDELEISIPVMVKKGIKS